MKTCQRCGRESEDHAVFCKYCGNRFEETSAADTAGSRHQDEKKETDSRPKKKFLIPAVAGAVLLAAAAAGGGFLALRHTGDGTETDISGTNAAGTEETKVRETPPGLEDRAELLDLSGATLVDNYSAPESAGVIDLMARNHQPGARDTSARWNKDLFYWLEDIGGEDDNHIAESILTRMELTETGSGHTIQYEVYRDPETEEIQKIVSIEPKEDGSLELSDYYYQGGKPDFVFRRSDSIYTPSYATIDKTGERYYFSEDQMVKWRWIYEPSVVNQWILEPEDTWYTQWAYGEISDGERSQYDEKELQVLNEAYNTYDAVLANDPVAVLQGRVVDENGRPIEEAEVGIGTVVGGEAQVPQVKVLTDETGNYCWPAEQDGNVQEYFLVFRKEGFIPSVMAVPDMGSGYQTLHTAQEDMVLLEEKGDESYTVTFRACQVEAQSEEQILARASAEGESEEMMPPLADAKVRVYAGVNWFAGEPAAEGESSNDGQVSMELPAGVYTAVIEKEGCLPSRNIFQVKEGDQEQVVYVMSGNGSPAETDETDSEWRFLLSWNASESAPIDLDSSLFTPDKAARGDRNCINTLNRDDGAGARLLYDGEGNNACEVITLSSPKRGSYKYYVSNYTGIQNENGEPVSLAQAGARVTLFHNGVPIRTFSPPETSGKVWEVFELRDQGIVPIQEIYESTEGKGWWTEDKKLARLSERGVRADWIQSDGEWLYFSNPADDGKLYYCRKDGSDLTKFSDDYLGDSRILLIDDQIYYVNDRAIVRIKNDGTGRTVIKDGFQLAEIEDPSLYLLGYADGMLYYFNAPETFGLAGALFVGGEGEIPVTWPAAEADTKDDPPRYSFGQFPANAVTVGHYLYYMDIDYNTDYRLSFCRKELESGQEECLKEGMDWNPWSWRIYKGWIYYNENGALKRTRLSGPGSFSEEYTLVESGDSYRDGQVLSFYGDTCYYYQENDDLVRVMNLDGGGQKTLMMPFGQNTVMIDGELYTKGLSNGPAVMVYDRNGENARQLFDNTPFVNRNAMEAYAGHLEYFNPMGSGTDPAEAEMFSSTYFACQDVDGDGICELFIDYSVYSHSYIDYYRFGYIWGMQAVLSDVPAYGIVINRDEGQIVMQTRDSTWEHYIERYDFSGTLLDRMEFYFGSDDNDAQTAAYDKATSEYILPYPTLNFVENTPENRQNYLLNGVETGWVSQ